MKGKHSDDLKRLLNRLNLPLFLARETYQYGGDDIRLEGVQGERLLFKILDANEGREPGSKYCLLTVDRFLELARARQKSLIENEPAEVARRSLAKMKELLEG